MEIKHTIEILTKDIQDIEKLVGNLQNSQDGSAIELDLALSKLRNVYEILTMIKADRLYDLLAPEKVAVAATPPPEPTPEPKPAPPPVPAQQPIPEPQPEPQPTPDPQPDPRTDNKKEAEILAEKFSAESSINENLAGQRGKDMDNKLLGQPIENITRNIGINDRFLIIRELFDGNADRFGQLVNNLEGAGNYQDALNLLEEQFPDSMEHEGVKILAGLIKRRFNPS